MAMLPIKGIHVVKAKGREYVYAWRGGPRLLSPVGSPEFVRELAEAAASRRTVDRSKISGLVASYKESPEWRELADKTRKNWTPFLDKIHAKFGTTSIAAFDRPLIRVAIRKWRDEMRSTPRQADMALQVLSRLLSFGVAEGRLQANACTGIPRIYSSNRADIIWLLEDFQALQKTASREVMWAVRLAALTGLRKGDVLRLSWNHVLEHSIEMRTGKSGERKTAVIPLYGELRALLKEIPRRRGTSVEATTILTNTDGHPWKTGFDASFIRAKNKAKVDKHFHDLRGTAATRMFLAGLTVREIAEIFTWSEDQVERLINVYVKKDELLRDRIRRIDEHASRTRAVKPAVKPSS